MTKQQDAARARAIETLHHYIALLMRAVGKKPDGDTRAEVEGIVDDIIRAATPEVRQ